MRFITDHLWEDDGVSNVLEYIIITAVLLVLMVIMMNMIHPVLIERPMDQLTRHSYVDIGNGISTRIVDLYIIAPYDGTLRTDFDIPDDVAGHGYLVTIEPGSGGKDMLKITGDTMEVRMSLSGIGATLGVGGSTSSSGLNEIRYDSTGF